MWAHKFACGSGCTAVLLGAFGSHAIRGKISPNDLAIWNTAVQYQFWHTLALLHSAHSHGPASILFSLGITLFCGSLYALVLTGNRQFGAITPIGGSVLVFAWIALARDFYLFLFFHLDVSLSSFLPSKRYFSRRLCN